MAVTHTTAARNAATDAVTLQIGTGAKLRFYTSPSSVTVPGTVLATLTMTSNANGGFGASSGGTATAAAITSDTNATGGGTAAFAAVTTSANSPVIHFEVGAQVTTTITGSSGAATITVGSATGLAVGMAVSGTGIGTNARIVNINGTTITLSVNNSGAVSGTGTFNYDVNMTNGLTINNGDTVSCSSLTYTALAA